jgi:hypothetical protein
MYKYGQLSFCLLNHFQLNRALTGTALSEGTFPIRINVHYNRAQQISLGYASTKFSFSFLRRKLLNTHP